MQRLILAPAFAHFPFLEVCLHIQGLVCQLMMEVSASEAASFVNGGHTSTQK